MFHIVHQKEDKKIALQISQALNKNGFSSSIEYLSEKNITNAQLAIVIFSKKANISEKIISQYDLIFDNEIEMIPFVVSDLEMSVSMQNFLNTHDWINAFDVSTKEAVNDLVVLVKDVVNDNNYAKTVNKSEIVKQKNTEPTKNNNQSKIIIGIVVVFVVILLFFIFGGKNNPINSNNNPENLITGSWKLDKYEDNMPRSMADQADFINSVSALKQNFLLVFNEDETFEKYGFSQTEKGYWQYDPQNQVLYMWPPDSEDYKDVLKVEKLTQDSLIMSIATQIDSITLINTKFTLYKE